MISTKHQILHSLWMFSASTPRLQHKLVLAFLPRIRNKLKWCRLSSTCPNSLFWITRKILSYCFGVISSNLVLIILTLYKYSLFSANIFEFAKFGNQTWMKTRNKYKKFYIKNLCHFWEICKKNPEATFCRTLYNVSQGQ